MNYDSKYSGNYYQNSAENGLTYERRSDGQFAGSTAYVDGSAITTVQLTGYWLVSPKNNTMYQTTGGQYINMDDGWQYVAHAPIKYYSAKDTQAYVNQVIKANKHILQNNLFCARFYQKLTTDEMWELYRLQKDMENRNAKLISDGFCTNIQTSTPPGYTNLSGDLSVFMTLLSEGGIGAVIVSTTTIVVAAVIIASLATAAFFAYKYMAAEAEQDVKYSDELTKILMGRLTPDEYEQLMEETQGIVTKQKLMANISGGTSAIKWLLLAAAGFVIYKTIDNKRKGNKNE